MPITQTTPRKALQSSIDRRLNNLLRSMVNVLCMAGEEVVRYARTLPSPDPKKFPKGKPIPPHQPGYIDWTANLRSSIGYVVLWDGRVIVQSDFSPIKGHRGTSGIDGTKRGRAFLQQLISKNSTGLVLIVVAGMPYAAYVEALGYDVLDSAEIKANELVKRMLRKLKF